MGERIVDMEDAGAFCINKRITALKAEVAREHDYACELLAIVMGLGTILGANTSAAECVGTERAARRTVAQVEQLKGYLESLTPGGSEFHNYPVRCREWVEDRLAGVIEQVKRRKAAEAEVKRLRGALKVYAGQENWVQHFVDREHYVHAWLGDADEPWSVARAELEPTP